jgi:capsular polysaccharide biosynthesis protein
MINILVGFILGFFVATMGFTGVAQALDNGIETLKTVSVKVDTGK